MKKEGSIFKDELIKSGWYNDVLGKLVELLSLTDLGSASYPIAPVKIDNIDYLRVKGKDLIEETLTLIRIIENGCETDDTALYKPLNNVEFLYYYIKDGAEMLLHNYAIDVSHRHEPSVDMDQIRLYLVIQTVLEGIYYFKDMTDSDYVFKIPETWYKHRYN